MHLDVPDLRACERCDLPRGGGVPQRLVETDGRAERLGQAGVPDQLVGRERLLDVEQAGIVERARSEEHTSELQSQSNLVCRLLLEKKKKKHERGQTTRAAV